MVLITSPARGVRSIAVQCTQRRTGGREGGGGRMRDKRPRGPCGQPAQSIDNMLQLRTPPARGGKIVGSLLQPVKTSTTIRRKAPQFRPPLRATVPPNGSKTCTKQSFRTPTRSIHPRASRAASHPGCVVCARSPTNRRRVTAQGDGLSFDAADEQLLSALDREEQ